MSTLLVHECDAGNSNTVFQEIIPTKNINLSAIRPNLYIHNGPSGTVKVEVRDEFNRLIKASATQTITALKTLAFAHGYFRFNIDTPLIKNVKYRIAVVCGGGYTFAEGAYLGVLKDWDDKKTDQSYTPNVDFNAPLDFEIWERNAVMRELDFSDSFESSVQPSQGSLTATAMATFANDAAYEADKGSVGVDGDAYYNTTIDAQKYNDSGTWKILDRIHIQETPFAIANNQGAPANVTGLLFDGDDFRETKVKWHIIRDNAGATRLDVSGSFRLSYNATDKWVIDEGVFGPDDPGVTFSVDNVAGNVGQIQYTSTDIGGTPTGTLTFEARTFSQ